MSALTQDVKCPCGEEFEAELFAAVNAQREPELKDAVLAGQLNVVECSMCRRLIYAERFVLYHDPAAELLAFVYPADFQAEEARWKAKTEEDFAAAASAQKPEERLPYRPMTLFGLDALAARLSKEQEQADQGQVAELLAEGLALRLLRLKPSLARSQDLPPVLVLAKEEEDPRRALKRGLERLLLANDRLTVYAALRDRLSRDGESVAWTEAN
jgi:hypothetical protein